MIEDSYLVAGEVSLYNIPVSIMGREIVTHGLAYFYSHGYRMETPLEIIPYVKDDDEIDPYIFNYGTSVWTNLNTGETFAPILKKGTLAISNDDQSYSIHTKETGILVFAGRPEIVLLSPVIRLDSGRSVYALDLESFKEENGLTSIRSVTVSDESVVKVYHGLVSGKEELRINISTLDTLPWVTELVIYGLDANGNELRYTYLVEVPDNTALGDINGDLDWNLADAIMALQFCAGLEPYVKFHALSDINGDGRIGVEEAIFALQTIVGIKE